MLEFKNLNKTYGKIEVLQDINGRFDLGQSIALIGPNGSGKTTFIKSILGMVMPNTGEILFNGQNIANECAYRSQMGYMPQIGRYPDNMQVGQLFEMMKDIRLDGKNLMLNLDEELIEDFKLKAFFNKNMRSLSGGMRQKVSAALAFLFNPLVMILDEPTAGLDPLSAEVLKSKILRERDKNRLFIITSHIMSDLDEVTTDVMYLVEGKLIFLKPIGTLKEETGEQQLGKALAKVMSGHLLKKNLTEKVEICPLSI